MAAAGSRLLTPKPVPLWAEGRYYSALSGVEIDLKTALELAAIDKAAELSG